MQTQIQEDDVCEKIDDIIDQKENDSAMDLQEIEDLAFPSRFVLDDWKSTTHEIIPSKEYL